MHKMVLSHGKLKTMSIKELDGGSATESGGDVFGPGEKLQTVASSGGVQARLSVTRSETATRRLSRSKADALVSITTSSKSIAHCSKRCTAAIMVKELSGALASAKRVKASPAVIQDLENQLLDCVVDCAAKPKCARGDGSESGDGTDAHSLAAAERRRMSGRGGQWAERWASARSLRWDLPRVRSATVAGLLGQRIEQQMALWGTRLGVVVKVHTLPTGGRRRSGRRARFVKACVPLIGGRRPRGCRAPLADTSRREAGSHRRAHLKQARPVPKSGRHHRVRGALLVKAHLGPPGGRPRRGRQAHSVKVHPLQPGGRRPAGGRGEHGVGDATLDADAGLAVRGREVGRRGALGGRCPPGGRGAGVAEVRGAEQAVAAATASLPASHDARGDGSDAESRDAASPSRSGHGAAVSAAAHGNDSVNTAGAAAADGGRGGGSGIGDGGRAAPADPGGDGNGGGAAAAGGGGDGGGPPSSSAAAATADAVAAGDNESPTARGRGRGLEWTEAERVALCQAWLAVAQDPVVGTDQSRATFAAAIVNGYESHRPMGPGRRARTDTAIDPELRYSVFKNVQRFIFSMVAVGRRQMTGNLTDEDLIRMATAHFDAENLYEAVQVDDNDGDAPVLVVKKGGTKGADWVKGWTVMRKLVKLSGAVGGGRHGGCRSRPPFCARRGRRGHFGRRLELHGRQAARPLLRAAYLY